MLRKLAVDGLVIVVKLSYYKLDGIIYGMLTAATEIAGNGEKAQLFHQEDWNGNRL